jgi:hypothetical protein
MRLLHTAEGKMDKRATRRTRQITSARGLVRITGWLGSEVASTLESEAAIPMISLSFPTTWGQSGASGCRTINHWQLGARKPHGARLFGVFALVQIGFNFQPAKSDGRTDWACSLDRRGQAALPGSVPAGSSRQPTQFV